MSLRSASLLLIKSISLAVLIVFTIGVYASGISDWSDKTICRLIDEKHSGGGEYPLEATKRGLICKSGKISGYIQTNLTVSKPISSNTVSKTKNNLCSSGAYYCDKFELCEWATTKGSDGKLFWKPKTNHYVIRAKKMLLNCTELAYSVTNNIDISGYPSATTIKKEFKNTQTLKPKLTKNKEFKNTQTLKPKLTKKKVNDDVQTSTLEVTVRKANIQMHGEQTQAERQQDDFDLTTLLLIVVGSLVFIKLIITNRKKVTLPHETNTERPNVNRDDPSIEDLLEFDPSWPNLEIKKHLLIQSKKWNERLSSTDDGPEKESAKNMINLVAEAENKYR